MLLNKKGVSLVEMMIALVILLLVFLALMQVALLSIDSNLKNELRDEAVNIAEQRLTNLRNKPFTDGALNAGAAPDNPTPVTRYFRNIPADFNLTHTITDNITSKNITVSVGWTWKGENFTHTVTTIKRSE